MHLKSAGRNLTDKLGANTAAVITVAAYVHYNESITRDRWFINVVVLIHVVQRGEVHNWVTRGTRV